jgi:hypothetical protein
MKRFLVVVLITCCLSSSGQDLKIADMVFLLDKSKELFHKDFWKSATLYASFEKPVETLEKELMKYGFKFNNYDSEEGDYDEVDLRYLTKDAPRKEFRLSVQADANNSLSYSFRDSAENNELKKELEQIGGAFQKTKKDTLSVPGMDNISIDHSYIYKDKIITLTESWFVMSRSAGKPDYYVWIRYKY